LPTGWSSVFCEQCGSPLPHLAPEGPHYFVPAGVLDDDPQVPSAVHIFVGSKASWDEIHGSQPQFLEGMGSERVDRRTAS
jgi:hypothetical protein